MRADRRAALNSCMDEILADYTKLRFCAARFAQALLSAVADRY